MVIENSTEFSARDAAKLFSSKRITEVASDNFSYLLEVASHLREKLPDQFTVADVFECAYLTLSKDYRSEYFFKNTVAQKILLGRHSLNTATVLPEFRVGRSKADCVILNGNSTCYEIKSDFDNLDRLSEQLSSYRRIFDRVFVVVGGAYLEKVQDVCSDDIGILQLTSRKSLRKVRDAKNLTDPVDIEVLMRSLRVNEYREMASFFANESINCSNTEIFSVCQDIMMNAPPSDVRKIFCETLKKTRKIEKRFIENLPRSLLMAGIGFKLSSGHRRKLLKNLNIIFSKDSLCIFQFCGENSLS